MKAAPHLPEIADPEVVAKQYKHWRFRIYYSMFIGYALYYFLRKGFIFAMPGMMLELQLDKAQLGFVSSVFAVVYGISKFANGILSDRSNPRYFMALGLFSSGALIIFIGCCSSLFYFAFLWGLNGWFQGFGWPPCVRLLSHWYSHSERGSWWSSWTISQNVGAFLIPWIVGISMYYFDWRIAMFVPGGLCILGAFFLVNRLADTPQSLGLPPIERFQGDYLSQKQTEEEELSAKQLLLSVLKNPSIWILALAYFFIYAIRAGVETWAALYLIEAINLSPLYASGLISFFEIGGLFGGLFAGWISDRLFRANRGLTNALFSCLIFLVLLCFWFIPKSHLWLNSCLIFLIGFATFGPQVLIGVAVAESAHKKASATATGFAGWVAYIGAATAGFPLGKMIDSLGWEGFFFAMILSSLASTLLLTWGIFFRSTKEFIPPSGL